MEMEKIIEVHTKMYESIKIMEVCNGCIRMFCYLRMKREPLLKIQTSIVYSSSPHHHHHFPKLPAKAWIKKYQ